jgi:3-oxoacyl-[acyl-carrier-protein] synthase II
MRFESSSGRRRVAVTGAGIICALGRNQDQFWAAAMEGRCGIGKLDLFDASGCLSDRAAQAEPFDPPGGLARRRESRTDRFCIAAAAEAVAQAGLEGRELASFGVSLGCSNAGMLEAERYVREGLEHGADRAGPSSVLGVPTSAPADAVARRFGCAGPRVSNMTACASSAVSIGLAADLIRAGDAPGMLAGGGDSLCLLTHAGFNALRLLDPGPCRPFDASRQGLSLGEGAGLLVMEDWERAARRGARPLAEFLDYGASCDAHHMTAPHPSGRGAASAISMALQRSSLSPDDIGHINAHGTGTPMNDAAEARAIVAVFGAERTSAIPITSTKSMIGHLLGGSGAVEAVAMVLSLMRQAVPPTLGFRAPDEETPIVPVAPHARRAEFEFALSNSFGFGGSNCALIFRRSA